MTILSSFRMILNLLRVRQWVKNVFLFFPLLFAGQVLNLNRVELSFIGFFAFSFLASGFYIINDIMDLRKDRFHPDKSARPLASGAVSPFVAGCLAFTSLVVGMGVSFYLGGYFPTVALLYALLQVSYNFGVKKIVVWDVMFIAFGFILRVWAGAEAIKAGVSFWLLICVFVLALFLGFVKRRNEMNVLRNQANQHRDVLRHYSVYLLDQFILLTATLSIVFYSLYTISPDVIARVGGYRMVPSVVFVIYGMLRYLFIAHILRRGGDPSELLLKDRPLIFAIICWCCYIYYILYT